MYRLLVFIFLLITPLMGYSQNLSFDQEQGAKGAEMVRQQMGLIENEKMEKYINEVGQKLVGHLEERKFDYTFKIVDMVEPNAFALPGGHVYVSRGILPLMKNEHELAGVLGHEIIHVNQRHSYKQNKKSILPSILMVPGSLIGAFSEEVGALINTPIAVASKLGLASYSRKQEKEADDLGIELVAKAGYDPQQLSNILNRISLEVELLTEEKEKFSYFDDHPLTPDRVKDISERAQSLERSAETLIVSDEEFSLVFDGLYLADNPEQGVFREDKFYHIDLGIAFDIPKGWSGVNSPMYVGAKDPDGKGQLVLGIVEGEASTQELADSFAAKLQKKYQVDSYKLQEVEFNEYKGHVFAIDEYNRGNPINYTMVWFSDGNITYQMVCYGEKRFEGYFNKAFLSFHKITEAEKSKVNGLVMRLVEPKEGESLQELSKRTGNKLKPELTVLINDLEDDAILASPTVIKIGRMERYQGSSN